MDANKKNLMKLALVCVLCIGFVSILVLVIEKFF